MKKIDNLDTLIDYKGQTCDENVQTTKSHSASKNTSLIMPMSPLYRCETEAD